MCNIYMYKFPLLKTVEPPAVKLGIVFPNNSENNSVSGKEFLESKINVSV